MKTSIFAVCFLLSCASFSFAGNTARSPTASAPRSSGSGSHAPSSHVGRPSLSSAQSDAVHHASARVAAHSAGGADAVRRVQNRNVSPDAVRKVQNRTVGADAVRKVMERTVNKR
jgi:hypothetical protein